MRDLLLRMLIAAAMLALPCATLAVDPRLPVQSTNPGWLVGTWQSGNFAYTFNGDGSYVYVGVMGGGGMQTRIAETGTYRVVGRTLVVYRQRGLITNTNNYRQPLEAEATTFPFALFESPQGATLRLTFPAGGQQDFYRR